MDENPGHILVDHLLPSKSDEFWSVMAKSLVIVESPAKAKTINRYLGKDYVVKSSVGHIRDLPTGGATIDPKARAEEAKKTRALSPEKREIYKKERARRRLIGRMGVNPITIGMPPILSCPEKRRLFMN